MVRRENPSIELDLKVKGDFVAPFEPLNLIGMIKSWPIRDQEFLDMYVNEAMHFFPVIAKDLEKLTQKSLIKEVGSGIGMLSMLVADRDFRVVSFEPESAGFSIMKKFRSAVSSVWLGTGNLRVEWIDQNYSAPTSSADLADYIFAVNVIEHVPQWSELIVSIIDSEKSGAKLRLIFPNYIYPYEPHFQIPTLFNKRLTKRVMAKRILKSRITDPNAFWNDLSWPTGGQVAKHCREMEYDYSFSHQAVSSYFERFLHDEAFRDRKGKLFTIGVRTVFPVLTHLVNWIPGKYLPVIDVTISRR